MALTSTEHGDEAADRVKVAVQLRTSRIGDGAPCLLAFRACGGPAWAGPAQPAVVGPIVSSRAAQRRRAVVVGPPIRPMASFIEDYALLSDTQAAALVGRDGSIDWLCLPRFDSGACFAHLLGGKENGRWLLSPAGRLRRVQRAYRPGTLVLETVFECDEGVVRVIDFMPPRVRRPDLVRVVEGIAGEVPMNLELVIRFDYGSIGPWTRRLADGRMSTVAGPDGLVLLEGVPVRPKGSALEARFSVRAGERIPFVLTWYPSHEQPPECVDAEESLDDTTRWWNDWSSSCGYQGPWREAVITSLCVLKALTFAPTGGIVAAPTSSLPERVGGVRNWDYRYCWLRDATFTLSALAIGGHRTEAAEWRDWLLRAVAGDPAKLQIMYGVSGERRLPEWEVPWLHGFHHSRPVRVGNAAVTQFQMDVYGEVMDALDVARRHGIPPEKAAWDMQRALLGFLTHAWTRPDHGLWEVRSPPRHFTHSKMMAWVAFDRAIAAVQQLGMPGPVEDWIGLRDQVHAEVCSRAWDNERKTFTQTFESRELDASLLLMPQVGFLPPKDPRVVGTVAAIERELMSDGLVMRYRGEDGLPGGEGAFLACTFWLADCYALMGRTDDAQALFEKLLALRNDVGLLAEEWDPVGRHMLGNFPQAFSHVGIVNTAFNLTPGQPTPSLLRSGMHQARP